MVLPEYMLDKLESVLYLQDNQLSSTKNFCLGVGAQRCGSTWLGKYLEKHPQFCMSPLKEMHVFDSIAKNNNNLEDKFTQSLSNRQNRALNNPLTQAIADRISIHDGGLTYFQYFDQRLNDQHLSFGEITPEYALLTKEYLQAIYSSHTKTKVFMLVRRPVSRYISALQYWGRSRPQFDLQKKYIEGLKQALFNKYTRYDHAISNLQSVIPRDRLYVEYYEKIFEDPDQYLSALCSFLQIRYVPPKELSASLAVSVNASPSSNNFSPTEADIARIYMHFSDVYKDVPRLINKELPESWADDVRRYSIHES